MGADRSTVWVGFMSGDPRWKARARMARAVLPTLGALALVAGAYAGYRRLTSTPLRSIPAAPMTLRSFAFETVKVDARGIVRERRQLEARSYAEDLGGGVTLELVAIPGGMFQLGSPPSEPDARENEGPRHAVGVAPFFIGKFEVTQEQWRAVARLPRVTRELAADPSTFKGARRPVEHVSWYDALEFCARLGRTTGRAYRLPSEAEWAYAARAGTTTPFLYGATITPDLVNYDARFPFGNVAPAEDRGGTTDVGSVGFANAFGLFDVHGNVWEWTQDVWHGTFDGAPTDGSAWIAGGDATRRVMRGGAWDSQGRRCRSAVRHWVVPEGRGSDSGFRVACGGAPAAP